MKEAELKRTVEDYLQIQMNMGRLYFDRLNSGNALILQSNTKRRIRLCREGTADFFVLYSGKPDNLEFANSNPRVIFLELKGEHGKESAEQKVFAKLVMEHGAEWHLITSIDDLETALFGDIKDLWV